MLMGIQKNFGTLRKFGLPYDAEVEYIQSTGTQVINTGVNPVVAPRVVADMSFTNTDDKDYWGNSISGVNANSVFIADYANHRLSYYRYASANYVGATSDDPGSGRHSWDVGKQVLVDRVLKYTSPNTYSYDSRQSEILIFRSGRGNPSGFRLYAFRIFDGDEIVRDFVPVRFTNSQGNREGALYDRAHPTGGPFGNGIYPNEGTGSFVVGRDKNKFESAEGYESRVEYIQSAFAQCIDTGVNPETAPVVLADIEFLNDTDTDYWGNTNSGVNASSIYIADFAGRVLRYYRYASNSYVGVSSVALMGRHMLSVGKQVTIDGNLVYTSPNTYSHDSKQSNILLFRSGRGNPASFRLYTLQVYDGDSLVRDFTPVRVFDNIGNTDGALYDSVTKRVFTNSGSSPFTIGPDV